MTGGEQFDPQLIETIVREVIRRLTERGVAVTGAANGAEKVLNLEERVVALATLENRLDGVRRVVVSRRAVVTPSVYDELKDKGIELVRR